MAIYNIATPNTNGSIRSADTASNYSAARAGTGNNPPSTSGFVTINGSSVSVGQRKPTASSYDIFEGFTRYVLTSIPSTVQVVSAKIGFSPASTITGTQWDMEVRDFGTWTALSASTYVAGASISGKTLLAKVANMATNGSSNIGYVGSDTLVKRVARLDPFTGSSTTLSTLWNSSRTMAGTTPTTVETYFQFRSVASGSSAQPASSLIANTLPITSLGVVGGVSLQLTDGAHVWLDTDSAAAPNSVTLRYMATDQVTTGDIASWTFSDSGSTNLSTLPAYQNLALVRDASNNLYVIGKSGGSTNSICIKTMAKGVGLTWTQKAAQVASLPAYTEGSVNNFAATWHATTSAGHIMLAYSHRAGQGRAGQFGYAVLNCAALLNSSGTVLTASGSDPSWMGLAAPTGYNQYTNDSGTGLDVISNGAQGVIFTYQADGTAAAGSYSVTASGTVTAGSAFSVFRTPTLNKSVSFTRDANSKIRLIPIDSARFAQVGKGTIVIRNWSGTVLGSGDIWSQVLGSLSNDPDAYEGITTWDAIYDPASNKIWYYYLSSANQQQLMRTGFSLASYSVTGEEVVVNAAVSGAGTNTSLRVSRGVVNERRVKVDVANVNGTTYTTYTTYDSLNLAPNPPTLAVKATFNATTAQTFTWTFNDANTSDSQTAYRLQIVRVSDGVVVYDTAKTASATSSATASANTLVNAVNYQWRVMTWDLQDAAGAWSPYSAFSTVSAATVTITSPATDGTTINTSSITLTWSVAGGTQAQYRPQITNLTTGITTDGGYRSSVATAFTWTGLNSSASYRLSITIKDGGGVESNPGLRTFTTDFVNPMKPAFMATTGDTYIELAISNPEAAGSEPEVDHNDVYRKRTPEPASAFVRIGSVPANGVYRDYAVQSGVSYDYKVTGVSA
ncbi:glycoside hydrolase family 78 protein [Streptomyces globisporus]